MLRTKLLLLLSLLYSTQLYARPVGDRATALAAAQRKARFGDFSFLCNLLCESAEDDEDDCDYPFDGSAFCEGICSLPGNPGATTTTTAKPTPKPSKTPGKFTTPAPPKTTQAPIPTTAPATTTPTPLPPPTMPMPSGNLISPTASFPTYMPYPPAVQSGAVPLATATTIKAEPTTLATITAESTPETKPEAMAETPEAPPAASEPDPTTEAAPEPAAPPAEGAEGAKSDLEASSDNIDVTVVAAPTTSEVLQTSSKLDLKPTEPSTPAQRIRMEALKQKLMPYMPELITLWCEYRMMFPTAETAHAIATLCPKDGLPKSTATPALYDLFLAPAILAQQLNTKPYEDNGLARKLSSPTKGTKVVHRKGSTSRRTKH